MPSKLERISGQIAKQKLPDQSMPPVCPPGAAISEEQWNTRIAEDRQHGRKREGHRVTVGAGNPCNIPSERPVCSCGWAGPWLRDLRDKRARELMGEKELA